MNTDTQEQIEKQEGEAGFAAGFSRVSGKEPEKDAGAETRTAEEKTATDAKAAEDAKVKAQADAKMKAEADRTRFMDTLPARLRNIEGHIGGLSSKLDAALAAAKATAQAGGKPAPTKEQVAAAQQSTERWKKLEQDFPDWAAALNERVAALGTELSSKIPKVDTEAIKKDIMTGMAPMIQSAKTEGRNLAFVDFKHEGWETTVKTKEFGDWLKSQSPETQALADSERAPDAVKLLDAYTEHTKALKKAAEDRAKKEKRLAEGVVPTGTGQAEAGGIGDQEAFNRGFNRVRKAK